MLVIGIYKYGHAITQIKEFGCFTVNFPDRSLMKEIEIGGMDHGKDKFKIASALSVHKSDKIDAPIIDNCILTVECQVSQIIEPEAFPDYSNIFAKGKGHLTHDTLQNNGNILTESFHPVQYLGDNHLCSYRYLDETKYNNRGDFCL